MNFAIFPFRDSIGLHFRGLMRKLFFLAALLPLVLPFSASGVGTWSALPTAPFTVGLMILQSDGSLLIFNNNGTAIAKLTPNAQGSYASGTWTTLKAMYNSRLYFSSQVLKDGRVYVAGGEYGTGGSAGEVYNPLTNQWRMAPLPGVRFSDANSAMIPDGRVLNAVVAVSRTTKIYDPVTNTWTAGPTCLGSNNESAWVRLPDESELMVDINSTNAERYIPSSNTWISDATVPVSLYDPYGAETGGAMMLPNGKAFFIGSLGHCAIYTPSGSTAKGSWTIAADIPGSQGTPDAPCAMLPNGKVLAAVSPVPTSADHFPSPTAFYEYDYTNNTWTAAPIPGGSQNHASYYGTMLILPDGTCLYSNFSSTVYRYTPDGTPVAAGKPEITSVSQNSDGTFHIVGTQLNGWSEGSSYGDDNQNATNYPIVRLTSGSSVYYARSFNWNNNGVVTGALPVTTEFSVPATVPGGTYNLVVVANGISSDPVSFSYNPITITLPASVTENGSTGTGVVTLPSPAATNLDVTLTSANPSMVTVPSSITVQAGATTASFLITPGNDSVVTSNQAIGISASAAGYQSGFANLIVVDDDTAVISITPTATYSPTGGSGGPFSPSSNAYTITNTGNSSVTWSAAITQSWLTLSPTSGTIPGGGTATVTLTVNTNANSLATGTYTDTVTFTNTYTGDGSTTRAVSLSVAGTPAMSVTAGSLAATGAAGGAFSPSSAIFNVQNPGTATLSWTAAKTASWLTLSSSSGTVTAGSSAIVTASINTATANALSAGAYSDTITFTNASNGNGNTTRSASLLVQAKVSSQALSTNPGWSTQGEWAYGVPAGSGGPPNGFADPTAGSTGTNVYGVNLSGNYSTTPGGPFYLTSTAFNCSTSTQTRLKFQRWLNTDVQPLAFATVEVSNNGSTWTQVYANDTGAVTDSGWQPVTYDISAVADHQAAVYVRWGYQVAAGALPYSGWNIDDVDILGNVNRSAPTATAQSKSLAFGATQAITLAGTDTNSPTGAPLSFAIANPPANGTLSGIPPSVSYTPALGYSGSDSFTFTATNLYGITSSPATVSLTVAAGPPVATPRSVTVAPDTPTAITLTGTDPNIPARSLTFATTSSPTHGTLSGTAPNLTYTPAAGYTGADSFTFTVNNGVATSPAATVSITVGIVNVVEALSSKANILGNKPLSPLVVGADGALYGTCQTGGLNNQGSVFKITTAGVVTTLVNFYGVNGAAPQAGLCLGSDGNFYGTTTAGGANNLGTIFKMTPAGVLTTLVSLSTVSPNTGTVPRAGLVQAADGNLYGSTTAAGASSNGTLFRVTPAGVFTVLNSFTGTTGAVLGSNCQAAMIQGSDGSLYGVTGSGGAGGFGTLFKMTTSGTFTTLVAFTGTTGGALGSTPLGALVQGSDGTLYGTTSTSGASANGTIFKCTTAGALTTLQNFTGSTGAVIGGVCSAPLAFAADGVTLYGTASAGSTYGSLFSITTAGVFTNIKTLATTDGPATPLGGMTLVSTDGNFYGTLSGNASNIGATRGGVFKLVPGTSTFSMISSFQLMPPTYRNLVKHSDNNLYATTTQGGTNQYGSVVKFVVPSTLTTLTSFSGTSGTTNPNTLIVGTDNNLYGTNPGGVISTNGALFKITTTGTLTTLGTFSGTTGTVPGAAPSAHLTPGGDGNYYGVTSGGGSGSAGVVFKITPGGTYTALGAFTGTTGALLGSAPQTRLVLAPDGNLYGTTSTGGTAGAGTVFRVNVSTGVVTSVISFTGTTGAALGSSPNTNLVVGSDGILYGTTTGGGTGSSGTVFSLTTAGVLTTLVNFTGTAGSAPGATPASNLIFGTDGNLYGTTTGGGASSSGTIYTCTKAGVFTSLVAFTGITGTMPGSSPSSMLLQAPDGWFYGTTGSSAAFSMGTVYRFHPSGMAQSLYAFGSGADGGVATISSSLSLDYRLVLGADGYLYGANAGAIYRVHQQPAMQDFADAAVSSSTSATLTASVVPNLDSASAYFEWGLATNYGTQSAVQNLPASTSPVDVSASLTGLIPGQIYHYRLVTITAQGTYYSPDQTFATQGPPIVITGSWTGTAQNGITVDGYINPLGSLTNYWFEYGESTDYDDFTVPQVMESVPITLDPLTEPDGPQNLSSGVATLPVSVTIGEGITPGTEFHIRLVAQNGFGTTYGDDQVITTPSPQPKAVVEPVFHYVVAGTSPQSGLTLANDGYFYGVTNTGGSINTGTAFRMSQGGTMTTLSHFYGTANNGVDGNGPQGALIQGPNGNLYGTTNTGGTTNSGTIFMITPDGTRTTLVNFTGSTGVALGAGSVSKLTLGLDGNFYGTTTGGGTTSGNGTVFMMTPAGVFTTLINFTGTSGANLGTSPRGLMLANDGNFYGLTNTGGTAGLGTIFKMTPAGVLTTLVSFTGTTGAALGSGPNCTLVQGVDGNLYGTTVTGGTLNLGTVFVCTPTGTFTCLVQFSGTVAPALGSSPKGALVQLSDGNFYGTTTTGGTAGGNGTFFQMTPAGVLTTLVNFTGTTGTAPGNGPQGALALGVDGSLYGTTSGGGLFNQGTLFKVSTAGLLTTLVNLTSPPVLSKLAQGSEGTFFGTTTGGGTSLGFGTYFTSSIGGAPRILAQLPPTSGTNAITSRGGLLLGSDGFFYGTSSAGGATNSGSVFKASQDGVVTTLLSFTGTSGAAPGSSPQTALILGSDGNLWGTTNTGGSTGFGEIFKITSLGAMTPVAVFTGTTGSVLGSNPQSPLLLANDGNYYGTTTTGGTGGGLGTVFKITPAGVFTSLVSFNNVIGGILGSAPLGALVQGPDNALYGVTSSGGTSNQGTVFKVTLAGAFTNLASFTGASGALPGITPSNGLFTGPDGHFYGVTSSGGLYNQGTLFRVGTDGSVQNLYSFTGRDDGIASANGLLNATDGYLYGQTSAGIFRVHPTPAAMALPAINVQASSATLNGSIVGEAYSGTTYFEYGLTTSYGRTTGSQAFSAGNTQVSRTAGIAVQPFLTYHYRLVAVTPDGTFPGPDRAFSTANVATFNTAADVPVTIESFNAGGLPLTVNLGFAPANGTVLKLVSNTGSSPVSGTFASLPEGSGVTATFNAQSYLFQISYAGGDGNDITLTATTQVIAFPSVGLKRTTDAAFNLGATSTSGLSVTYQIVAGGSAATLSGNTVTLTGTPGVVTLKATQTGNGGSIGAALPVYQSFVVQAAAGFVQVSSSKASDFSLGIRSDGTLWAWGVNGNGQLGDASTTSRRTPVQVGTATNWSSVSCGTSHAVALRSDGTMYAWGLNSSGQVGDSTLTQRTSPVQIGTLAQLGVTKVWSLVAAGATHCVAVANDGSLWAWGGNTNGQVGQSSTLTATYSTPTRIGTATTWSVSGQTLSAGGDFTFAIDTLGKLWAWGINTSSQLGDGSTTTRLAPVQIGSATTWQSVAAHLNGGFATMTTGTLNAWGVNTSGQVGDNTLSTRAAPVVIGATSDWAGATLAGGALHCMVRKTNGTLWTWGGNALGQLGQGFADVTARANTPLQLGSLTTWSALAGGVGVSHGITTDGALYSWGTNTNNVHGVVMRSLLPLSPQLGAVSSAVGSTNNSYFIKPDGSLWGLGGNGSGQLALGATDSSQHPVPLQMGVGFTWLSVSSANSSMHAIRSDHTLWACGNNGSGQLGDGTTTSRAVLVQIGTDADWNYIFDANNSTYAIKTNGTLWAWGANSSNQLGDGTTTQRNFPIQIGTDTNWRMVAGSASSSTTFAAGLKTDGSLFTWGSNSNGQLGNGTTTTVVRPTQVGTATDWATLATGNTHVIALKTNRTLWAWGLNSSSQLGDGTTTQRTSPIQIGSASNWSSIAAGTAHSLATAGDGSLYAWGSNALGQFGNATLSTNTTPTRTGTGSLWSTLPVQTHATHSLIFAIDRTLWTAGQNSSGQSAFAGRNFWVPNLAVPALGSLQSQSFTAPSTVTVGSTITLSTTAGSAMPSSYIVTGPATLVGDQLTINSAGTVCVIAYQQGDAVWQSSDIGHALINATAPGVATLAATQVGATTATLNAVVNPNGSTSTAQFKYGADTNYGTNVTFALNGDHDVVPQNMTTMLTGLTPGTTYHFQAAAANSLGTTNGGDLTFSTPSINADLAALSFAGGTLTPAFSSGTTSYASEVSNATASITLVPVLAEAHASITLNGSVSTTIPLNLGSNIVSILVTAQDGITTKTYTLAVTRRTRFQDWVLTSGVATGASGALQDSDGDGIPNLLEWAFGGDPTQNSAGILNVVGGALTRRGTPGVLISGNTRLAVFGRRMDYLTAGLTYSVEFSADFSSWKTATDIPTSLGNDGEIEAVTVPFPAQVNGQEARFFRVRVNAQ
ncbi:choice-of-anchor tandem repeat GloVer-containing protein [Prosthecobacter sp.]|uniref:choice-of-anchor tandem repeat GloVer-containing protein n=1 Tax=Prosthecobacter sp. TaxID=1965333 RepID=UPI0037835186